VCIPSGTAVKAWNMLTGKMIAKLQHKEFCDAVFSHNNKWLLTTSQDGEAKLWNTKDWTLVHSLAGETNSLGDGLFSSDDKYVFIPYGDKNTKIRKWETATGRNVQTFSGHKGDVHNMYLSRNDELLATVSLDNTVKTWNTKTGKVKYSINRDMYGDFAAIDPSNKYLATGDFTRILVYDLRNETLVHDLGDRSKASSLVKYSR
ncbi:MAG: hypothetical protein EOO61_15510, partial [Hymenobacter sp.]